MVNVYNSIRDDNGNINRDRTKLFILSTLEDGSIEDYLDGYAVVPEDSGTLFIVDQWIIDQVDKLKLNEGQLVVKDGEMIEAPQKSEADLQEEDLLRQLAELRAKKSESTTE